MASIMLSLTVGQSLVPWTSGSVNQAIGYLQRAGHRVIHAINQNTAPDFTHNKAATMFMASDCEYLASVDCDMGFPRDVFERLLACNADIAGTIYRRRGAPHELMGARADSGLTIRKSDTGIVPIYRMGVGVILYRRAVFETLRYPWFYNLHGQKLEDFIDYGENIVMDCNDAGLSVVADLDASREVVHWNGATALKWDSFDEMPCEGQPGKTRSSYVSVEPISG